MKESKETTVWKCGICGKLHWNKTSADACCQDRTCAECGKVLSKNTYYIVCDECRAKKVKAKELELFEKADKYTIEEYMEKFPNYYAVRDGDMFFYPEDIEFEFDDPDKTPDFIWGTQKHLVEIDPYEIIGRYEEEVEIDDYRLDDKAAESIKEFCKEWNEKYAQEVFMETTKVAILLKQ